MNQFKRFQTTLWTQLLESPGDNRGEICARYRDPIYSYVRFQGLQEHDAQDAVQEVFTRVCRDDFLKKTDRMKGKFRTLLLAVTRNVLSELRTRPRFRKHASLDTLENPEQIMGKEDPALSDANFDRLWVQNLVRLALQKLMEYSSENRPPYYDVLVLHMFEKISYAKLAEQFSAKTEDISNWIQFGKKKLKEFLREQVRYHSPDEQEISREMGLIKEHLGSE